MFSRQILKIFPPPLYLSMPHAGLDISDECIRMVKFEHGSHGLKVADYGEEKLPVGLVDAGYIHDEQALIKILSAFSKKHRLSFVKASLPEEKMYLFKTDIADVPKEEDIRQRLEFKLEENVPLTPADAVFYYDIVPGSTNASVSVAPRKVVDTYLGVMKGAGLTLLSFEIQAKALARALIDPKAKDTVLLVHIMGKKTGLYIVCEGVVNFTSTVAWGGKNVTDEISKAMGIKEEDAIKLKKLAGYHDHKDSKQVLEASMLAVGSLQKEISKVYGYWKEHGEGCKDIDRVIVCGSDALLVGLSSRIVPASNVSVEISSVWRNAFSIDKYIPPVSHDDSLDYAVAIGLGL